jgi:hypothetical protein
MGWGTNYCVVPMSQVMSCRIIRRRVPVIFLRCTCKRGGGQKEVDMFPHCMQSEAYHNRTIVEIQEPTNGPRVSERRQNQDTAS